MKKLMIAFVILMKINASLNAQCPNMRGVNSPTTNPAINGGFNWMNPAG